MLSKLKGRGIRRFLGLSPRRKPLIKEGERKTIDRFVFICGLHRSGTTLVEHYLSSYAQASLIRAPVYENEGQHLQNVYPQAYLYGGPGRFAFHSQMTPSMPTLSEAAHIQESIARMWSPWIQGYESTLIEKSPPNLTKIDWLRRVFPNSCFLIVARDPRAVAAATLKWSKSSIAELVYHWHVAYGTALESYSSDCYLVTYENFCENPHLEIERICNALHLPKRETPLPIEERFRKVRASNEQYIQPLSNMRFGEGCWREFGYTLPK